MEKLIFTIEVKAKLAQVWFALFDDYAYRQWTQAFTPGSYATGTWQQGGRIHFLSPAGEGIFADIEELVENERMIFKHMGVIADYKEMPENEKTKAWAGAYEKYFLTNNESHTTLRVELDTLIEYREYFNEAFPRALQLLKQQAENQKVVVTVTVNADVNHVWNTFTTPRHIARWCFANDDWHAPSAQNDLRVGGKFSTAMAARDGSFSFEWEGTYTEVTELKKIAYTMPDGREVEITFTTQGNTVTVTEAFHPEKENSLQMQKAGWQAILNNFKKYAEATWDNGK